MKTAKDIFSFGDFLEVTFENEPSVWFHDHKDGTSYREHVLENGVCKCGKTLTEDEYKYLSEQFPKLRKKMDVAMGDDDHLTFKYLFEREMFAQNEMIDVATFDCNMEYLEDFILFEQDGWLYQQFSPTAWTPNRIYLFLAQKNYVTVISRLRNPKNQKRRGVKYLWDETPEWAKPIKDLP